MNRKIKNNIFLYIFIFSNAFSSNYIDYSISYSNDNNAIINDDGENVKTKCYMIDSDFSFILNEKYYITFIHKYNNEKENDFMLPAKGDFGFIDLAYHLKERSKFPLNMSFGFSYGESYKKNYIYNNINIGMYKKLNTDFYPILLSGSLISNSSEYTIENNSIIDDSYISYQVALDFLLNVNNENSSYNDVIYIGFNLSSIDSDLFGSINIGIKHPL